MLTSLAIAVLALQPLTHHISSSPACGGMKQFDTQTSVELDAKPVHYIRDMNLSQLQQKMGHKLYEWQKENNENFFTSLDKEEIDAWTISGSSKANVDSDIQIEFISTPFSTRTNYYCPFFKSVAVKFTYQMDTTIANDFDMESCAYKAIKAHELQYDKASRAVVENVVQAVRDDMPRILNSIEGEVSDWYHLSEKTGEMEKALQQRIAVYKDDIMAMIDEYNKMINTPEAFEKMAQACSKSKSIDTPE